jgi:predicted nucleotide-binding protein (sugar kinase/HSP70/actin superfamily)
MHFHRCSPPAKVSASHLLANRMTYLPTMAEGSSEAVAACFRWLGMQAQVTPPSDERTRELGGRFVNGDECYPALVTLGDLMRAAKQPGFDPRRSAFLMPTADGPCRFGQYAPFLRKVLRGAGLGEVIVISPTDRNGYADLGEISGAFMRMMWRALVCNDYLQKALHHTRPYELHSGTTDAAFRESLQDLCATIESCCGNPPCQLQALVRCVQRGRERFRQVPAQCGKELPLIGVVGEIFCRLNAFANENLVRRLESLGAEAWVSDIKEWVDYATEAQFYELRRQGRRLSLAMLRARLRARVQQADAGRLSEPFAEDWVGYEEPDAPELLELAAPYLPADGVAGEMVLSMGKASYLAQHGADGVIDISPFTCMNGIVSEAIYPKLSRDLGGIPIRNFYFEGTETDVEGDLTIFLELVRSYRERKKYTRNYPVGFGSSLIAREA